MSSRMIPREAIPHFENMIYLPMLVTILSRDKDIIEHSQMKLKNPYLHMIEKALSQVQKELRDTHVYLRQNKMKLVKGKSDESFTEYIFLYNGYDDTRRYFNVRLRNRSEELLSIYLTKNGL